MVKNWLLRWVVATGQNQVARRSQLQLEGISAGRQIIFEFARSAEMQSESSQVKESPLCHQGIQAEKGWKIRAGHSRCCVSSISGMAVLSC